MLYCGRAGTALKTKYSPLVNILAYKMSVSGTIIMLPKNGLQPPIRRRRRGICVGTVYIELRTITLETISPQEL